MKREEVHVVVLGTGPLGLGLLGCQAAVGGLPLTLVGRRDGSRPQVSATLAASRFYKVVTREDVADVHFASLYWTDVTQSRRRLKKFLADAKYVVVFTALRGGQTAAVRLVREALEDRAGRHEDGLFVIAPCENAVIPSLAGFKTDLPAGVGYLDTVADRICPDVRVVRGRVQVTAGAEIDVTGRLLLGPGTSRGAAAHVRHALRDTLGFELVHTDRAVAFARDRKLRLLNGVHLVCALLAHHADYRGLGDFLGTAAGERVLDGASREFGLDLYLRWRPGVGKSEVEKWRVWYAERIAADDDTVARVLSRLRPNTLAHYMDDVRAKLLDTHQNLTAERGDIVMRRSVIQKAVIVAFEEGAETLRPSRGRSGRRTE